MAVSPQVFRRRRTYEQRLARYEGERHFVVDLQRIASLSYVSAEDAISWITRGRLPEKETSRALAWWGHSDMSRCASEWCSKSAKIAGGSIEPESMWSAFRREFHALVCTKDPRYAELRKRLRRMAGTKTQLALAGAMGAGLCPYVGITVTAVLSPLCAIGILGALELGKNSVCRRLTSINGFEPIGVPLWGKRRNANAARKRFDELLADSEGEGPASSKSPRKRRKSKATTGAKRPSPRA
jgi:hypothetical protein